MGNVRVLVAVPVLRAWHLPFGGADTDSGSGCRSSGCEQADCFGWLRSLDLCLDMRSDDSVPRNVGDRMAQPAIFPEACMDGDSRGSAAVDTCEEFSRIVASTVQLKERFRCSIGCDGGDHIRFLLQRKAS